MADDPWAEFKPAPADPWGEFKPADQQGGLTNLIAGRPQPAAPGQNPRSLQDWADLYGGAATGMASILPGIPGAVETLARRGLSNIAPVSQESILPTPERVADWLSGTPSSPFAASGREIGNLMLMQPRSVPKMAPMPLAGMASKTGQAVGNVAAHATGVLSGAGPESVKEAFLAGQEGGARADALTSAMRGQVSPASVVEDAKNAVAQLRVDRSAAYRAGIGSTIKGDPTILDFKPIEDALNKAADIKTFKGQSLSTVADKAKQRVGEVISEWKALPPEEYHTPEGIDALKQKLGDLIHEGDLSSIKPNSPASVIVDNAYNAVKSQIVSQAPGYAKVMKDYSDATDQIRQIERTLSLNPNATIDTSLRKLQSILRNNANTNYGQRVELGNVLNQKNPTIIPNLAGQMLSSATPRGIQRGVAGLEALEAILHPQILPLLAASSPRLVGESAFRLGRALPNAGKTAVSGGNAAIPYNNSIPLGAPIPMMAPALLQQLLNQQQ